MMLPAAITVVILLAALVGMAVWISTITNRIQELEEWRMLQEVERRKGNSSRV